MDKAVIGLGRSDLRPYLVAYQDMRPYGEVPWTEVVPGGLGAARTAVFGKRATFAQERIEVNPSGVDGHRAVFFLYMLRKG